MTDPRVVVEVADDSLASAIARAGCSIVPLVVADALRAEVGGWQRCTHVRLVTRPDGLADLEVYVSIAGEEPPA